MVISASMSGGQPRELEMDSAPDFIELYDNALTKVECDQIVKQFESGGGKSRDSVGNGMIDLTLKDSWDEVISEKEEWRGLEQVLQKAAVGGLVQFVRKYPYVILAPLTVRVQSGKLERTLDAADIKGLQQAQLLALIRRTLRPGRIRIQKYDDSVGGYPYWHSEIFPGVTSATLERILLWTIHLNNQFDHG
jgi:hypothetical protein